MFSLFNNNQQMNGQMPKVNPEQINFVKNMLSQKGISAETWVRQICNQRGINVDEFMAQFKDVNL